MIKIGRQQEGITLNPLEWLLKPHSKEIKRFRNRWTARRFLRRLGYTKEDMEFMRFERI